MFNLTRLLPIALLLLVVGASGCIILESDRHSSDGDVYRYCPEGGCYVACGSAYSCIVDCPGGDCIVDCENADFCQVNCDDGYCDTYCQNECETNCPYGGCHVECDDADRCSSYCDGWGCSVDCDYARVCRRR